MIYMLKVLATGKNILCWRDIIAFGMFLSNPYYKSNFKDSFFFRILPFRFENNIEKHVFSNEEMQSENITCLQKDIYLTNG